MKQVFLKPLVLSVIVLSGLVFAVDGVAKSMPDSFADLVDEKSPTVVNISTSSKPAQVDRSGGSRLQRNPFENHPFFRDFFGEFLEQMPVPRNRRPSQSLGSGVIISADGYIVTNNHVVEGADDIVVKFNGNNDDEEHPAEIVGRDAKNDIALIKVDVKNKLPYSEFANSDKARVGDWVVAIGNPFGLGGSVTAGIISARGRNINQGPYDDFLQTDAAINPGNSGGPLFDMDGNIVGINTAILSRTGGSQGIGFAIPSNTVQLIMDQLKEYGKPIRGWLGVRIQHVTPELAEAFGLEDKKGALVAGVVSGSPADKAEIKDGDIIVKFDGRDVSTMQDLPKMVAETKVGKRVPVIVMRDGDMVQLSVKIDELDEEEVYDVATGKDESRPSVIAGMSLSVVTDEVRDVLGLEADVNGLVVENVDYASRAARSGIRSGDVILQADRKDVETVDAFSDIVAEKKGASLLLLISREGENLFLALKKQKSDKE